MKPHNSDTYYTAVSAAAAVICLCVLAAQQVVVAGSGRVSIKINDATPTTVPMTTPPPQTQTPIAIRPPGPLIAPLPLLPLAQHCFQFTTEQYRYELCPFRNATQRDKSLAPNSLNVLLGIWKEWELEDHHYKYMIYDDGTPCANRKRSLKVDIICGTEYAVSQIAEPETCKYEIQLALPESCGDAMIAPAAPAQPADASSTGENINTNIDSTSSSAEDNAQDDELHEDLEDDSLSWDDHIEDEDPTNMSTEELTHRVFQLVTLVQQKDARIEQLQQCIEVMLTLTADPSSLSGLDATPCAEFVKPMET